MNWKASPPRIERAAIWTAAACLGGASGFAFMRIAPLGAGLVEASVAGAGVAVAGWLLVGRVDRRRRSSQPFVANESLGDLGEVVLLDQPVDDGVLLLDDPLPVITADSRVVRLFAADPNDAGGPTTLAGPSEMIARIENFLGQTRGGEMTAEPALAAQRAAAQDANAALHAALADIRATLRHG